jgi:hypothetical protein
MTCKRDLLSFRAITRVVDMWVVEERGTMDTFLVV